MLLRARDGKTSSARLRGAKVSPEPYIDVLRTMMADFRSPFVPELRFTGGAVGYLGYDLRPHGSSPSNCRTPPIRSGTEGRSGFYGVRHRPTFDHVQHRILIIANALTWTTIWALYQFACTKIDFLERELRRTLRIRGRSRARRLRSRRTSRRALHRIVKTTKEYIAAGDVYQVVLSQRFEAEITTDPFTVYRACGVSVASTCISSASVGLDRGVSPGCWCAWKAGWRRRIRSPARGLVARPTRRRPAGRRAETQRERRSDA